MIRTIAKEIKDEILEKIKKGEKVVDLTKEYGLGQNTIYTWLEKSVDNKNNLAIGNLKRENRDLKILVAELTLAIKKGEKNRRNY